MLAVLQVSYAKPDKYQACHHGDDKILPAGELNKQAPIQYRGNLKMKKTPLYFVQAIPTPLPILIQRLPNTLHTCQLRHQIDNQKLFSRHAKADSISI